MYDTDHTALSGRFSSPSSAMNLSVLLRRTHRGLIVATLLALGVHLLSARMGVFEAEKETVKPLTTKFIKREPRLSKPLEMKKRPQPKRRQMQRKMVSIKAKVSRRQGMMSVHAAQVVASLAKPRVRMGRSMASMAVALEPRLVATVIEGSKTPENRVDMSLEMMDTEALDTGQYHAMVIQDPTDKKNIKGFFHLAIAYSTNAFYSGLAGGYYERPKAIPNLVEAMNKWTDIKTDIVGAYLYTAKELFKIPWVYTSADAYGRPFRITDSEAECMGKYMFSGGFFMVEDAWPDKGGKCDMAARTLLKQSMAAVGYVFDRDWNWYVLPNDHPIFHCYFDFNGSPVGGDFGWGRRDIQRRCIEPGPYPDIDAIVIDGRVLGIMSNRDYEDVWAATGSGWAGSFETFDNTRALQFGVNIVIFALTQEGSITNQVMDNVH